MAALPRAARETPEGTPRPDRDARRRCRNEQAKAHPARGGPGASADPKQQGALGPSRHGGRAWQPMRQPERGDARDVPDPAAGKAGPRGSGEAGRSAGWVGVGRDHGAAAYPRADQPSIGAAGGGRHGDRRRPWQGERRRRASATGLAVRVRPLPPGTRTWNKSAPRLFAPGSPRGRGRPVVSRAVIVELIGATTTTTGPRVQAAPDRGTDPTTLTVADDATAALHLTPHPFDGAWNCSVAPWP